MAVVGITEVSILITVALALLRLESNSSLKDIQRITAALIQSTMFEIFLRQRQNLKKTNVLSFAVRSALVVSHSKKVNAMNFGWGLSVLSLYVLPVHV